MKKLILFALLSCSINNYCISQEVENIPLTIDSMFKIAEENNRAIKLQKLLEESSREGISVSKNALLPSIDFSLSACYLGNAWITDRNFSNGITGEMPHFGNNISIEASQILFAGGAIKNSIKNAKVAYKKTQMQKLKCKQDIKFALLREYLQIFHLENQVEIYSKNIIQTQKLVDDILLKAQEGVALKNDITRYELQLQNLQLALTQVKNNLTTAQNRLRILLELPTNTKIKIDKQIINELPILKEENEWLTNAIATSPDIRLAQLQKEESENSLKIVRAQKIPTIVAFAGDKLEGPITIEVPPINKNLNYWYVGVGVKYNIASLYKATREERQASLGRQIANENEKLAMEELEIKINETWTRFNESFSILETHKKSLELANNNYEIVNNRYLNDLALITDMLDASNSKLSAELQMADSKINILMHYFNLCRLSGTL